MISGIGPNPRRSRRTALWSILAVVVVVYSSNVAYGEYLFLTDDPRAVQQHLITDMQNGTVDLKNMSISAQTTFRQLSNGSMSFPDLASLGKLNSVCPTN